MPPLAISSILLISLLKPHPIHRGEQLVFQNKSSSFRRGQFRSFTRFSSGFEVVR